jgi:hypothetical protein
MDGWIDGWMGALMDGVNILTVEMYSAVQLPSIWGIRWVPIPFENESQ